MPTPSTKVYFWVKMDLQPYLVLLSCFKIYFKDVFLSLFISSRSKSTSPKVAKEALQSMYNQCENGGRFH